MALVVDLRCGQPIELADDSSDCPFCNQPPLLQPPAAVEGAGRPRPVGSIDLAELPEAPAPIRPASRAGPSCSVCGLPAATDGGLCDFCVDERPPAQLSVVLEGTRIAVGLELPVGRDPRFSSLAGALARYPDVGRRHGRFLLSDGVPAFVDCGSRNGSSINGVSLLAWRPAPVTHGDQVSLGESCVLTVELRR